MNMLSVDIIKLYLYFTESIFVMHMHMNVRVCMGVCIHAGCFFSISTSFLSFYFVHLISVGFCMFFLL